MDLQGLIVGLFSFTIALSIIFFLLKRHDLNRKIIMQLVLLSGIGHWLGAIIFYWFAVNNGCDSKFYFYHATTKLEGLGWHFVVFCFGLLRKLFLGDSFLGAFLFSASLGFIGSVFYLITYKTLLDSVSEHKNYFLIDYQILYFPSLVLLCWPSYFFWSAGLGKDSVSFLAIGIFLYVLSQEQLYFRFLLLLLVGVVLGFAVRPYLFLIGSFSVGFYMLFTSKIKPIYKIIILFSLLLIASQILMIITRESNMTAFTLAQISRKAVANQTMTSTFGISSIPVPTSNPYLIYIYLPYLMLANLFLPLFIKIRNLMAFASSIENLYFIYLVGIFLQHLPIWRKLRKNAPITDFLIIYFLIGMSFLSLINTNLGIAIREKMMYVPALLIVILLTCAYRRILFIQLKAKTIR